ncbi:Uncharacterised protein [uncultured Blautia sp.]|nr:Uncharacterised protein [uncultured Blautia sp.]
MALHGEDGAHHDIGDLGSPVLGGLHLGAGEGHGLGKVFIVGVAFSEGHVPAENSLTQPPWAAFTSDRCHW